MIAIATVAAAAAAAGAALEVEVGVVVMNGTAEEMSNGNKNSDMENWGWRTARNTKTIRKQFGRWGQGITAAVFTKASQYAILHPFNFLALLKGASHLRLIVCDARSSCLKAALAVNIFAPRAPVSPFSGTKTTL